jgi:hypothetical protein
MFFEASKRNVTKMEVFLNYFLVFRTYVHLDRAIEAHSYSVI